MRLTSRPLRLLRPPAAAVLLSLCLAVTAWTAPSPATAQDTAQDTAQNTAQNTVLQLNSRLVTLDVSVRDAAGNPVTNLNRSDFTVYENGTPQTIRNFEGFSEHLLSPTLTAHSIQSTADLERLAPAAPVTLLVLDEFNTDFSDTAYARIQIRKFLLAQPPTLKQPTSLLAATDGGFQQVADYTLDRQHLLDALAHLPPTLPGTLMRTAHSPEGLALRFAVTLDALQQIAKASIGHPGRKNIIWIGRGFDSLDLRNEADHQIQLVVAAAERAVNLLRQAHATVYTVDPTLSTKFLTSIDASASADDSAALTAEAHNPTDPFNGTVSFNTIAPLTGGRAFAVYNNLDQEIASSIALGSAYYSIAYVPAGDLDADHPFRKIDVRVDRPGVLVSTRHGYYAVTPALPERTPAQALKAQGYDLGSAIESGLTFTGLTVQASILPAKPGQYIVQVATKDIGWAPQPDGTLSAHLTLVAAALNAHGKLLARSARDVVARLKSPEALAQAPFTTLTIELPDVKDGRTVRIAVKDNQSGKLGTVTLQPPAPR